MSVQPGQTIDYLVKGYLEYNGILTDWMLSVMFNVISQRGSHT